MTARAVLAERSMLFFYCVLPKSTSCQAMWRERLQRVTPDIHPRLYLTCGNIIPRAEAFILILRVGGERGPVTKRKTAECRHESLTGVMEAKAVCVCVFISP